MDHVDKQLLNAIQVSLPLTSRPFAALGDPLALSEAETLHRIASLKDQGIIRQISAIFDTRSLGYSSALVAMSVLPERLVEAARIVNEHPGVSHNYERHHFFNLWFTIAVPPGRSLEENVHRLHQLSGATSARILPNLRLFKIGVRLDMNDGDGVVQSPEEGKTAGSHPRAPRVLSPVEVSAVRELQEDLELQLQPFEPIAARLRMSQEQLFDTAHRFIRDGIMRRFAAVLHHRKVGFEVNAMGVWVVPSDQVERVGSLMAGYKAVSHCYQRPSYPDWPYNVFTMIHGRSRAECEAVASAISGATGISEYRLLFSGREFKKVRVRYFAPEHEAWEERYLTKVPTS